MTAYLLVERHCLRKTNEEKAPGPNTWSLVISHDLALPSASSLGKHLKKRIGSGQNLISSMFLKVISTENIFVKFT